MLCKRHYYYIFIVDKNKVHCFHIHMWFIYKICSRTNWTLMAPSTNEPNVLKILFSLALPLALLSISAGVLFLLLPHVYLMRPAASNRTLTSNNHPSSEGKNLDWWNLSSYHAKPLPVKYSPSIWEHINFLKRKPRTREERAGR